MTVVVATFEVERTESTILGVFTDEPTARTAIRARYPNTPFADDPDLISPYADFIQLQTVTLDTVIDYPTIH